MATSSKYKRLLDAYTFPGFRPLSKVRGVFGDPKARVITLVRRSKKLSVVHAVWCIRGGMTAVRGECATCPAQIRVSIWKSRFDVCIAEVAAR